jgi:diguanylate cyclase (GGDEF)-like protein
VNGESVERVHLHHVRRWALWTTPSRVVALILTVNSVAVLVVVTGAVRFSLSRSDVLRFLLLAALAVGYTAVSQRIERARQLLGRDTVYADVTSTWTLPAAVLLPGTLTAALIVVVFLQRWLLPSSQSEGRSRPHRFVYTAAATLLTCAAVSGALAMVGMHLRARDVASDVRVLLVAVPIYICVATLIIGLAVYVSTGTRKPAALLGSWSENGLELATLVLGAMTALSLLYAPWAAVLVLPAVFLLQHQALLRQLVEAATTDVKTELLNAMAWRQVAQREIARVSQRGGSVAILVLDMDHFKRINDEHGHLAGDAALKCVGSALADELRGYDAVGRFGGEEFVAVLPSIDGSDATHAAERLRRRIESLAVPLPVGDQAVSISVSIGVALCPDHGDALDDVLRAADDAMYQAKQAGRNTVRVASAASLPAAPS